MDQVNWIVWLVIGIVLGWLLELLVDYLFWNRRYGAIETEAKAEIAAARQKLTNLQSDLDKAVAARNGLQSQVATLQSQLDDANAKHGRQQASLAMVAAAAGSLGALGQSLVAGDDGATRDNIEQLELQLAAGASTDPALLVLRADTEVLAAELELAAADRIGLEEVIAVLQASLARTMHNAGLVAAAGGLVGSLGNALEAGDEAAVGEQVAAISTELNGKANALWEALVARKAMEKLESQLAQARAAQAVLQRQADATAVAQRTPPPVAPPVAEPVTAPENGGKAAAVAPLSALALLLSGKEPPALDAERLQALTVEVEETRNVRGQDLLQMIDGIDANCEARLYGADITTYQKLEATSARHIAAAAGVDPQVAGEWIQQANEIGLGARPGRNRLTVLRGLESSMQEKLYAAGITTYADVADSDEARLHKAAAIRSAAAPEIPIWIFQARLLAGAPYYSVPHQAVERTSEEKGL